MAIPPRERVSSRSSHQYHHDSPNEKTWDEIKKSLVVDERIYTYIQDIITPFLERHHADHRLMVQTVDKEEQSLTSYLHKDALNASGHSIKEVELEDLFPPFLKKEITNCYKNNTPFFFNIDEILLDNDTTFLEIYQTCAKETPKGPKESRDYRAAFHRDLCQLQNTLVSQVYTLVHSWNENLNAKDKEKRTHKQRAINEIRISRYTRMWLRSNNLRIYLEAEVLKDLSTHLEVLSECTYQQALHILANMNLVMAKNCVKTIRRVEATAKKVKKTLDSSGWGEIKKVFSQHCRELDFYNIAHFEEYCSTFTDTSILLFPKPLFSEEQKNTWKQIFSGIRINDLALIAFRLRSYRRKECFPLIEATDSYIPFLEKCRGMLVSNTMKYVNTLIRNEPSTYFEMIEPLPYEQLPEAIKQTNMHKVLKMLAHLPLKIEKVDKDNIPLTINSAITFINHFSNQTLIDMMGTTKSKHLGQFLSSENLSNPRPSQLREAVAGTILQLEIIQLLRITRTLTELDKFPQSVREALAANHYEALKSLNERLNIDGVKQAKDEIEKLFRSAQEERNFLDTINHISEALFNQN